MLYVLVVTERETKLTAETIQTATPAEIDAAWEKAQKPAAEAERAYNYAVGRAKRYDQSRNAYEAEAAQGCWDEAAEYYAVLTNALETIDAIYEAEWDRRGGWARYWLVPGGCVHDYYCYTLTPGKTLVGMLTEASGLDEKEVIERYQTTACSKCFPDAPVAKALTAVEQGYCEGSGTAKYEYITENYQGIWGRCEYCDKGVLCNRTSGGLRKHKP